MGEFSCPTSGAAPEHGWEPVVALKDAAQASTRLLDDARRALEAWDTSALKQRDGMLQERMECLRAALEAWAGSTPAPAVAAAPLLDTHAQVGYVVFNPGVSWETVIESAKRHYRYNADELKKHRHMTREERIQEEINRRRIFDMTHDIEPAAQPEVAPIKLSGDEKGESDRASAVAAAQRDDFELSVGPGTIIHGMKDNTVAVSAA